MGAKSGTKIRRVALIGNSPPRLCGIATFTADVSSALRAAYPDMALDLYAMTDPGGSYAYGPEVTCEIRQNDIADYNFAAQRQRR
jgi:hypothetical protein